MSERTRSTIMEAYRVRGLNFQIIRVMTNFYRLCMNCTKMKTNQNLCFRTMNVRSSLSKLISEYHLSANIYEIAEQINNSDYDFEIIEAYAECMSYYHKDVEDLLDNLSDSYYGEYSSDEEFAQTTLEQDGSIPENLPSYIYIDWEATARHLMYDYMSSNGYYFRN